MVKMSGRGGHERPDGNTLVDEMEINLNMLRALVLNGVGGELDGVGVIAIDHSGPRQGVV
jgi:hypothetical protein